MVERVPKVLPIAAVAYSDEKAAEEALARFAERAGPLILRSPSYNFSRFTSYYDAEMGPSLEKFFAAFGSLMDPGELVDLKLYAMGVEDAFRKGGQRTVNLDPGYLEFSKLVLATTKNFDHRVYLAQGIYADIQLRYRRGRFQVNDWTYPDYKSDLAIEFFSEARQRYVDLEKASRAVPQPDEPADEV